MKSVKRCEKCTRKLVEQNTSPDDPDLCRECFGYLHRLDHVRMPYADR
jgi:hypothetical protein